MEGRLSSIKTVAVKFKETLQDPYLVSGFQNYFGIFRLDSPNNGHLNIPESKSHNNGTHSRRFSNQTGIPTHNVLEQKACAYTISNLFWYYIFSFGSSLGYEMFYATFFPFWTWNLDSAVCRKVVNMWVFVMYIGQALKDIIRWPRPSSPPVVHMELKYIVEYGMPSTHAMVAVALPFSLVYFTVGRYQYPIIIGISIAFVWCVLVCCSRLYMGMHTVLDIIGGLLLSPILMLIFIPFSSYIDYFQQRNMFSPVVTLIVMILLQVLYPKSSHWTPARGDTAVIIGTGTGFGLGSWLNYQLGFVHEPYVPKSYDITFPSFGVIYVALFRTFIGLLFILVARITCKTLLWFLLCRIKNIDYKDKTLRHNPSVDIPCKFMTYIVIGLVIMFFAPWLFNSLGIARQSMSSEI